MDVTQLLDTRVSSKLCTWYMTSSDCPECLCRCKRWSATVSDASSMKALLPKPQCNPSLLLLLWSCHTLSTKQVMVYMNPNQTAKTIAQCLWQGYISIFRALAKLLSDWGADFESNIIKKFGELMGIWKVRTSPYHAQTNGQVEQAHKMLMHMIGKLSKDWKLDWLRYLQKLVHAYNSTKFPITRYSPHYLMFGCWLH